MESTQAVVNMESAMGGPTVEARDSAYRSTTVGFFEYATLGILGMGLGGLVWMRKHVHKA